MYMLDRAIPRNRPIWVLNGTPMRCKSVEAWEHDVTIERLDGTQLKAYAAQFAVSARHTGRKVYWISQ